MYLGDTSDGYDSYHYIDRKDIWVGQCYDDKDKENVSERHPKLASEQPSEGVSRTLSHTSTRSAPLQSTFSFLHPTLLFYHSQFERITKHFAL